MDKFLVRIAALLLLPGLIADPAAASGFSTLSPLEKSIQRPRFETQAIVPVLAASLTLGSGMDRRHPPFAATAGIIRTHGNKKRGQGDVWDTDGKTPHGNVPSLVGRLLTHMLGLGGASWAAGLPLGDALTGLLERTRQTGVPLPHYQGPYRHQLFEALKHHKVHPHVTQANDPLAPDHMKVIPLSAENTRPHLPWRVMVYLDGDTLVVHEAFLRWLRAYAKSEAQFQTYLAAVLGHEHAELSVGHEEAQGLFPLTLELEAALLKRPADDSEDDFLGPERTAYIQRARAKARWLQKEPARLEFEAWMEKQKSLLGASIISLGDGSGFVVAEDPDYAYVLTNSHVVRTQDAVRLSLSPDVRDYAPGAVILRHNRPTEAPYEQDIAWVALRKSDLEEKSILLRPLPVIRAADANRLSERYVGLLSGHHKTVRSVGIAIKTAPGIVDLGRTLARPNALLGDSGSPLLTVDSLGNPVAVGIAQGVDHSERRSVSLLPNHRASLLNLMAKHLPPNSSHGDFTTTNHALLRQALLALRRTWDTDAPLPAPMRISAAAPEEGTGPGPEKPTVRFSGLMTVAGLGIAARVDPQVPQWLPHVWALQAWPPHWVAIGMAGLIAYAIRAFWRQWVKIREVRAGDVFKENSRGWLEHAA